MSDKLKDLVNKLVLINRAFLLAALTAVWVAVTGFRPIETEPPPLVEEEWTRLERGEVVVGAEKSRQGHGGRVLAAILIDSPVKPLWEIMVDHKRAPEFVPGLRDCKILERDEEGELLEHRVKFSWFLPEMTYVFRAWYLIHERIDFKRVRGDLKALEALGQNELLPSWHPTSLYSLVVGFVVYWVLASAGMEPKTVEMPQLQGADAAPAEESAPAQETKPTEGTSEAAE